MQRSQLVLFVFVQLIQLVFNVKMTFRALVCKDNEFILHFQYLIVMLQCAF